MTEMFMCTEEVYHKQAGRPDVFIAQKGDLIPYAQAVALGLVAPKPAVKARKVDTVENKALKPSEAQTKSAKA